MWPAAIITILLLNHCYFQIQLQVWFYHDGKLPQLNRKCCYFVVRVRCRHKKSSRSLSHLVMSFLFCTLCRTLNLFWWMRVSIVCINELKTFKIFSWNYRTRPRVPCLCRIAGVNLEVERHLLSCKIFPKIFDRVRQVLIVFSDVHVWRSKFIKHLSLSHYCTQWVKKLCHCTVVHNSGKCWPTFKIISTLYSP